MILCPRGRRQKRKKCLKKRNIHPLNPHYTQEMNNLLWSRWEYLVSQGGVFITTSELEEEGNPQEPPMPSLELTVIDYRGRELDPIIEQANHEFISDDKFVQSRAFYQFSWRRNIKFFKETCNKMKRKNPKMEEEIYRTK